MSLLDDHTRAQLDAYATTVQPSAESRRGNRARLLERIAADDDPPEVAAVPLRPAAVGVRWSVVAVAAAVLFAVALGWALRNPVRPEAPEPASQAESTVEQSDSQQSSQQTRPPATVSPPSAPTPGVDVDAPLLVAPPPAEPSSPGAAIKPRRPSIPLESLPAADAPPDPASQLAAEVALISEARAWVTAGRDADALASFQRHARKFPRGALAEERAAWLAILQCRLGRAAGPASAAAFLDAHPSSPHVARVRKTCSTSVTDPGPTEE